MEPLDSRPASASASEGEAARRLRRAFHGESQDASIEESQEAPPMPVVAPSPRVVRPLVPWDHTPRNPL